MNLSDLQRKDIVDISNGKRLGRIIDAEVNETGLILKFYVEQRKLFRLFHFKEDFTLTFNQIKRIGEDVILVSYSGIE